MAYCFLVVTTEASDATHPSPPAHSATASSKRSYAYYDLVMAAFVCVLLCSNFIGAAEQAVIDVPLLGSIPLSAGILFFPSATSLATS